MFRVSCSTCNAKFIVKDESLIGHVMQCPQCNALVHVWQLDEAPTPYANHIVKPSSLKRFPDVLSSEHPSSVIGDVGDEV